MTKIVKMRRAGGRNTRSVAQPFSDMRRRVKTTPAAARAKAGGPKAPPCSAGLAEASATRSIAIGGLLLVPGLLDGGGCGFWRRLPGRHRDGDVVDDPTHRRPQILIEEVLVIGRGGELGGHLLDQRVLYPRVAALVGRNVGAFLSGLLGVFLLAEEIKEVDRLLGRRLGDEEAVDSAERIGRLAFAA